MRIERATKKQINFACKFFHYARRRPQCVHSYSVYNGGEWCGVILFGYGANPRIAKPFNLWQGQVIELVRVALNGKQNCTSQALSMALKKLKAENPQIKIVVSYADKDQKHKGVIYQATNWLYVGEFTKGDMKYIVDGKEEHRKSVGEKYKTGKVSELKEILNDRLEIKRCKGKYKYLFFFDKKLRKKYLSQSLPYPKE